MKNPTDRPTERTTNRLTDLAFLCLIRPPSNVPPCRQQVRRTADPRHTGVDESQVTLLLSRRRVGRRFVVVGGSVLLLRVLLAVADAAALQRELALKFLTNDDASKCIQPTNQPANQPTTQATQHNATYQTTNDSTNKPTKATNEPANPRTN